jgi:hypothetical protein
VIPLRVIVAPPLAVKPPPEPAVTGPLATIEAPPMAFSAGWYWPVTLPFAVTLALVSAQIPPPPLTAPVVVTTAPFCATKALS